MNLDRIWLEVSRLVPEEVGIPREDLSRYLSEEGLSYSGYCTLVKAFQFGLFEYEEY